jgi:hypothetical protein
VSPFSDGSFVQSVIQRDSGKSHAYCAVRCFWDPFRLVQGDECPNMDFI